MAEAEDVLTDIARHTTVYIQRRWARHQQNKPSLPGLRDFRQRLDLLIIAAFGKQFPIVMVVLADAQDCI
ncbi:MAG: hypothetical protein EOP09_15010 [Proteobacteria bacterium]|nr:MAG: hypothetical protein EOP09_15010 [Pseudomonadota bacterium]